MVLAATKPVCVCEHSPLKICIAATITSPVLQGGVHDLIDRDLELGFYA